MKEYINKLGVSIEIPDAKNSANAASNFNDRAEFDTIIPQELFESTMDLRTQKALYGRINPAGDAIYPNLYKVEFNSQYLFFGFDFMQIMLSQFINQWLVLASTNLSQQAIYKQIQVRNQNFKSIDEALTPIYQAVFKDFHNELFSSGVGVNITDFDSYVNVLYRYLRDKKQRFTRESLIKSSSYPAYNTLLIYDLQRAPHGNDEKTYKTFYLDDSIYLMTQTLLRHGMLLDRHSPWRLALNLRSPQLKSPYKIPDFDIVLVTQIASMVMATTGKQLPQEARFQILKDFFGTDADGNPKKPSAKTEKPLNWGKGVIANLLNYPISKPAADEKFFTVDEKKLLFPKLMELYPALGTSIEQVFKKPSKTLQKYAMDQGNLWIPKTYYVPAYMTEVSHIKNLLVQNYNIFVDTAFQKRIEACPKTHKPIQITPHRKKASMTDNNDLTLINFLINIREVEINKKIPQTSKQAILNDLQKTKDVQSAYEKLHEVAKNRSKKVITHNMSRPDALLFANHLGCRGAHPMKNGAWMPCKTHEEYISLTKL